MKTISQILSEELGQKITYIENVISLLDEGNTIPFIARYRKEVTGSLNDEVLRNLDERLKYLRNLEDRKASVIASIEEQGKLTDELKKQIEEATTLVLVEDLYRPYKQKKRTRAIIAKEKGLEPLANIITLQMATRPIEEDAKEYISEEKGVITLIKAVEKLDMNIPLYILGTGSIEAEVKEYITAHRLESKVKMFGFKSGDELKKFVAEAKCIVLPSEWYENGPYAIMEAMSQGKPVIVSRYGGLPEIVDDGVTGFICKPFDSDDLKSCIEKVCALTADEYSTMSKNALEKAKREFDPYAYAEKLINHYQRLIKAGLK